MLSLKTPAAIGILAAAFATSSPAALLVYEGFNNYAPGTLATGTATNATGLTGNFTVNGAGGTFNATSGGLAFASYSTTDGNRLAINLGTNGIVLQAQLAATAATTGTLYSSYLVRLATLGAGATDLSEVRVVNASGEAGSTSYFRSQTNIVGNNSYAGASYYGDSATASSPTFTLTADATTVYMVVNIITNVGTAPGGTITQYILSADQYEDFKAAGFSESNLTSRTAGTGATNVTSIATDTDASGARTFNDTDFLQLGGRGDQIAWDELKFGTTLADVVPEPSSAMLSLLGAAALFRRRR